MNLGELEKQILQYFWDSGLADAKQVHAHFEKHRGGSLNTIQSTLDRLFKKKLLTREKVGYAFKYQSGIERNAFIAQLINDIASDFNPGDENPLLAAFTSLSTGLNDNQLDELERLIDAQRSASKSGRKK